MKSEPDRLDLLVVLLPAALLIVLGVQAYHFFQSREGRAAGAELAQHVEELAATKVEIGAPVENAKPGGEAKAKDEAAQPAADGEAHPAADAAAAPAADDAATAPDAGGGDGSVAPAPAGSETSGAAAATSPAAQQPASSALPPFPPPQPGPGQSAAGPAAVPNANGARGAAGAGGTVIGGASQAAAPATTPGDEPARKSSRTSSAGPPAPDDTPAKSEPRQPALVTATPQSAEAVVGQVIPVDIRIASGTNVGSVPFHLRFDPKVIKLNTQPRSERGPFLAQAGSDPQFLVATGPAGDEVIVGLSLLGASSGPSGEGGLCTIFFVAVAPGTSTLQFTHASVRGPDARILPATFVPSAIKVNG